MCGMPLQTGDPAVEGAGCTVEMIGRQWANEWLLKTLEETTKDHFLLTWSNITSTHAGTIPLWLFPILADWFKVSWSLFGDWAVSPVSSVSADFDPGCSGKCSAGYSHTRFFYGWVQTWEEALWHTQTKSNITSCTVRPKWSLPVGATHLV